VKGKEEGYARAAGVWVRRGAMRVSLIIAASDAGLEGVPDASDRGDACRAPARPPQRSLLFGARAMKRGVPRHTRATS
jgi:hypothetical protein